MNAQPGSMTAEPRTAQRSGTFVDGAWLAPNGGDAFVPAYLELLGAGGSRSPEELGQIVGVDLADPGFWDRGLAIVDRQLEAAENAAREAGRL